MAKAIINGTEIEVDRGTSILSAAADAGHEIPHFCYHPALSSPANCRMCLVEVEGMPKLMPSCYTQVSDNMVIHTKSERVIKAQKAVLEFVLINHPVDCPICDQAGECKLQDYYIDYDTQDSRLRVQKMNKVKAHPIGPEVVYDGERCILCTRCIRFCEEVTETNELTTVERGDRAEIRTFPGKSLDNDYSVCVTDICPVGALTSRDFRFKTRVWLLTSTESICTGCSHGCNIHLDHFRNETQRYRPRFNPEVNDYWMCDVGRLSYKKLHTERALEPQINGKNANWFDATRSVAELLKTAVDSEKRVAFVISPQSSCEDLLLAKRFSIDILKTGLIFAGGNPAGESDGFLREKDKNPNTRGIEAIFQNEKIRPFSDLIDLMKDDQIDVLYMMGSELPVDDSTREIFMDGLQKLDSYILQSAHMGALSKKADLVLPACTHAEKNGTFVNYEGLAQSFTMAFSPRGLSLSDVDIFTRVAKVLGIDFGYKTFNDIQTEMFKIPERVAEVVSNETASDEPEAPVE